MSKRKRMAGRAAEMEQIAQVLRQNGLSETAVKRALLAQCGVRVLMRDCSAGFESASMNRFLEGEE